ncbi:MAG TPA: Crp/Fnr family transcriptional regulator [Candidatus Acidoferrales bacterium]|nr:Crp/Fnr family transcriptional regulator [Candidatus Acidoferrales bacterium]
MAKALSREVKDSSVPARRDADGNPVHNEILLSLPRKEWEAVLPKLEFVRLKLHQVLHEPGETLKSGYFCNSGLFSVLNVMRDGKSVEVGLIGNDGFSAVPLVAGFRTSHTRTIIQTEGDAFRIDTIHLRSLLRECPVLERQIQRAAHLLGAQAVQVATCNRLHEVDERLARWMLMIQDRIGTNFLPLTQEFMAQMLGTRRSTVTVSAGTLQKAGLITYTRGRVTILDRERLEEAACDCYRMLQDQFREWQSQDE